MASQIERRGIVHALLSKARGAKNEGWDERMNPAAVRLAASSGLDALVDLVNLVEPLRRRHFGARMTLTAAQHPQAAALFADLGRRAKAKPAHDRHRRAPA